MPLHLPKSVHSPDDWAEKCKTSGHSESANLRQGQNLMGGGSFSRREHNIVSWFDLEICSKVIEVGATGTERIRVFCFNDAILDDL